MTNEQLKDSKVLCTECEGVFSASDMHFPDESDGEKGVSLCGDCCWGGWDCPCASREEETPMAVTPTKDGMPVINFGDKCRWCLDEVWLPREWGEDVHSLIIGNEDVHNEHGERIVDTLDVLITGWLCTSCKAAEKAAEGDSND